MGPNDKCPPPSHTAEVFRKEVLHPELSYSIVGAAMKVLASLRPGLNEKAYENAMVIELAMRGHLVQQQRRFEVRYEGVVVDTLVVRFVLFVVSISQRSFGFAVVCQRCGWVGGVARIPACCVRRFVMCREWGSRPRSGSGRRVWFRGMRWGTAWWKG
jgi:PD-(D/E)XK nuclease superfamily